MKYTYSMETVQQNGRFILFSIKFHSDIYSILFGCIHVMISFTILITTFNELKDVPEHNQHSALENNSHNPRGHCFHSCLGHNARTLRGHSFQVH